MSPEGNHYATCIKAKGQAEDELVRLTGELRKGLAALEKWRETIVSGVSFPPETAMLQTAGVFSGENWPSGQEISAAIKARHKASFDLDNAFNKLSEEERQQTRKPNQA
jgi:hypothetical protein